MQLMCHSTATIFQAVATHGMAYIRQCVKFSDTLFGKLYSWRFMLDRHIGNDRAQKLVIQPQTRHLGHFPAFFAYLFDFANNFNLGTVIAKS